MNEAETGLRQKKIILGNKKRKENRLKEELIEVNNEISILVEEIRKY